MPAASDGCENKVTTRASKGLPALSALRSARRMPLALIGAIVGEFVSASVGLGVLIQRFSFQLLLPQAFACLLMLTGMGLLLYGAATFADNRVVFWRNDHLVTRSARKLRARHADLLAPRPAPAAA